MNQPIQSDLAKIVFNLLLLGMLIVFAFMIIEPFILAALWALLVVVATWPVLIKLQSWLKQSRLLATCILILFILLVFTIPFVVGVNHIITNSDVITAWLKSLPNAKPPALTWLQSIPLVGEELYTAWHNLLSENGAQLLSKIQPYLGASTSWIISKLSGVGVLVVQCMLMVLFSTLFYMKGETLAAVVLKTAKRIANEQGENAVIVAIHAIRAIALGVIVTALIQATLAGVSLYIVDIPYFSILTVLVFICCVAQIGPLLVLIPSTIWLYWANFPIASAFIAIIAILLSTMDNVLRPILIKKGADIPLSLVFLGVFGGMLSFGLLGLFVGPVVIAVSYRLLLAWTSESGLKTVSHQDIIIKNKLIAKAKDPQ